MVTGEGSGPRTVHVRQYLSTTKPELKAKIWLDVYGDGNVLLPRGEPQVLDAVSGPGSQSIPYIMPL